jgi:DNA-binding transcriptional ArsR family regulator
LEHSDAGRPLGSEEAELLAESLRVFATGSRIRLLFALLGGERSVEELARVAGSTPAGASQQLRVLRQLRFVATRRDGRRILYRLHDEHVSELLHAIRHHLEHVQAPATALPPEPRSVETAR